MTHSLEQLITEVCRHSPKSVQRRKAMNRLLLELQKLPGLRKSSNPDYNSALTQTLQWVNENICQQFIVDKPDIENRLVIWINSYLKWRIKDLYSDRKKAELSLDVPLSNHESCTTYLEQLPSEGFSSPTCSGLDRIFEELERQKIQSIWKQLEKKIQQDSQLKSCHPKSYPEVNCQELCHRVFLKNPPEKFTTLAKTFNINYQTLKSHWERNCRSRLKEMALELGYQPEE